MNSSDKIKMRLGFSTIDVLDSGRKGKKSSVGTEESKSNESEKKNNENENDFTMFGGGIKYKKDTITTSITDKSNGSEVSGGSLGPKVSKAFLPLVDDDRRPIVEANNKKRKENDVRSESKMSDSKDGNNSSNRNNDINTDKRAFGLNFSTDNSNNDSHEKDRIMSSNVNDSSINNNTRSNENDSSINNNTSSNEGAKSSSNSKNNGSVSSKNRDSEIKIDKASNKSNKNDNNTKEGSEPKGKQRRPSSSNKESQPPPAVGNWLSDVPPNKKPSSHDFTKADFSGIGGFCRNAGGSKEGLKTFLNKASNTDSYAISVMWSCNSSSSSLSSNHSTTTSKFCTPSVACNNWNCSCDRHIRLVLYIYEYICR
jgi:hypothetical protein